MLNKEGILKQAQEKKRIKTADIARTFGVSRQYASAMIAEMVKDAVLVRIGSTRNAQYVLTRDAHRYPDANIIVRKYSNKGLEEHRILDDIEQHLPAFRRIRENVKSIFTYAFTEMLNNAIEHSRSSSISVSVSIVGHALTFVIIDHGIGVYRNVMRQRKLPSPTEAMQDLLKGKTTTMPRSHSGEGIFFTSKVGDLFELDSFGYTLRVDNRIPDVFFQKTQKIHKGTVVTFACTMSSQQHLNDVFKKYTHPDTDGDYGFDKTEILIKLYTLGGVHISRSQARRVLVGLEKFTTIVFDFDNVPLVGQAFVDEIFRVFHHKYPQIRLECIHMNDAVEFMVQRSTSS